MGGTPKRKTRKGGEGLWRGELEDNVKKVLKRYLEKRPKSRKRSGIRGQLGLVKAKKEMDYRDN